MEQIQVAVEYVIDGAGELDDLLQGLSNLITLTGRDESVRGELASSISVWNQLTQCMTYANEHEFGVDKGRVVRGLVLLSRNLIVSCNERSKVFSYYKELLQMVKFDDDSLNLTIAILQLLVNLTSSVSPVKVEDSDDLKQQNFEYDFKYLKQFMLSVNLTSIKHDNCQVILLTYLNNLFNSTEFIYNFCNDQEMAQVVVRFVEYFHKINGNSEKELTEQELLLLSLFQKLFLHESFIKLWNQFESDSLKTSVLQISQLLLCNKDEFNEFELTSLLSWLCELYDFYTDKFTTDLNNGTTNEPYYWNIVKLADVLTHLGQFDHAREFLNHYNYLAKFCSLLHSLEIHFERQTLKESSKHKLGGLKTLMIEMITMLAYHNATNQDFVRTSHTLELILNNCQLDKNEPFIKERAIVCLKTLLDSNQDNQDFVKQLQPQKVEIQDEGKLEQMGLEIQIGKDGNVQLHNKNTDKIKELH